VSKSLKPVEFPKRDLEAGSGMPIFDLVLEAVFSTEAPKNKHYWKDDSFDVDDTKVLSFRAILIAARITLHAIP